MSAQRLARMRAALDRRQPDLRVLLDGVHKPHNLSAILRTCDAVGVAIAHAVPAPGGEVGVRRHASSGAGQWVGLRRHDSLQAAVGALRGEGVRILAAHHSERAMDFRSVDYTRPCAVLMGAELHGVSAEAAELADAHVVIPMAGLCESLNVSVAAAVILFEAQRQRADAGLYDHPRLDPQTYRRRLFEWLHPRIARHCRQQGRDYPEIDEDGDIIAAPG
ncbi:tRNA (guanosine(18)-2'-O)-methyltransferase TrmH [Arhodomonas sp. SL1]|uniref:tRNA (guanosine(18)-2'-O)-methyltransferase TrmH n=1 Tax=Arhodomonas sp. SL1 TaxID=3425691 RepID=UPI003F880B23